jgi:hypothetical protein
LGLGRLQITALTVEESKRTEKWKKQDNYTQVIKVFEVLLAVRSMVIVLLYMKSYRSAQKFRGIGCFPLQFNGNRLF